MGGDRLGRRELAREGRAATVEMEQKSERRKRGHGYGLAMVRERVTKEGRKEGRIVQQHSRGEGHTRSLGREEPNRKQAKQSQQVSKQASKGGRDGSKGGRKE